MGEVQIIMPSNIVNKFESCRHRSSEEVVKIIRRCSCQGGNYTEKGFYCNKRNIFKLDPNFCQACDQFETK